MKSVLQQQMVCAQCFHRSVFPAQTCVGLVCHQISIAPAARRCKVAVSQPQSYLPGSKTHRPKNTRHYHNVNAQQFRLQDLILIDSHHCFQAS